MAQNKYFQKHTFLAVAFYVFIVFLIAIINYYRHRESIYQQLDQHLAASAASVQYILADDFHDRALSKNSVLPAEDQENIRLLTQLARLSSVTYLYTVIIQNQHIYITSSSATEEDIASSSEVRYFTPYDEAVHLLTDKIKKDVPIQITYSDRWGTFRTSLLLCSSPSGNSYITGAEININDISAELRMELLLTFAYSFLLLGATIPLHLIYSARLRKHSASLKDANDKLIEEQKISASLGAELLQSQKMEAIGTLAGGIAHDFNNILSVIIGYAEMAEQDSTTGSMVKNDIKQVLKASHRAKDLVKQILTFSRHTTTEPVVIQAAAVINETIKLLRSSLPTTIAIRADIDQESSNILADPTQIHQILMNLCTNAFHAMEETGGILGISLKKKSLQWSDFPSESNVQPGDFLELSIADTGSGMAPEIQEKIFDPYFTTKEVGKGTGMGLAIIHGIVKSYGGFVTFESQAGEGTVFHVYFPALADAIQPGTKLLDLLPLGNESILFVDDEEILAEMGKQLLERLGYRVTVKQNSIEALSTFQNQPNQFDLIITDQTMPGMTGFDLAKKILQLRPGMPIILCTGYSTQVSKDKAISYGIKGFALKPLTKKDIAVLIRKVLDE
jgi:signal transduction histidine kinase